MNREVTKKDNKGLLIDTFNKFNELKKVIGDLNALFSEMEDCNEYIDTPSSALALPSSFDEWADGELNNWINESQENICSEIGYRHIKTLN